MRSNVLTRLQEDLDRQSRKEFQEKVLEEVIRGAQLEYSSVTEDRELDRLVEERSRAIRDHRLPTDTYVRESNKPEDEVRDELRPAAAERLTRLLVLRQVGKEENIEVSDEEVEEEIDQLAGSSGDAADAVRNTFSTDDAKSAIRNAIMSRKVQERLAAIVQASAEEPESIEEVEEAEASAETQGTEDSGEAAADQ